MTARRSGGAGRRGKPAEADTSTAAAAGHSPEDTSDGPPFEAGLERLEAIVDQLEQGDLPLEQALAAFEEGVGLTRRCASQLESAERRIEQLTRESGEWVAGPFETGGDDDPEEDGD